MSALQPPQDSPHRADAPPATHFECAVARSDRDAVWLRLAGTIDLLSLPQLEQHLGEAVDSQRLTVLDLRRVTFLDSVGAEAIIDADARARRRGGKLVLIRGPADVDRVLDLVQGDRRLTVIDLRFA